MTVYDKFATLTKEQQMEVLAFIYRLIGQPYP